MIKPQTISICAPDLAGQIENWQDYLRHERHVSRHTLRAYTGDIAHFITFLQDHIGKPPGLNDLSELRIRDFRAWMSRKAMGGPQGNGKNNSKGVGNASRARSLSGVKNFLRWLDKSGTLHNAAITTVRSPKLPHKLPRPLLETQAFKVLESADLLCREDWIGMRDRALFTLLYGCGLRIDEALSLNITDLPREGVIRVRGKGDKQREVPVIEVVEAALRAYVEICPFHHRMCHSGESRNLVDRQPDPAFQRDDKTALFVGIRGKRLNQGMAQKAMRQMR
ncbi:MAG: tyrosine-type recombinase/integrase, partial [Bdellovibrionales bacterium]